MGKMRGAWGVQCTLCRWEGGRRAKGGIKGGGGRNEVGGRQMLLGIAVRLMQVGVPGIWGEGNGGGGGRGCGKRKQGPVLLGEFSAPHKGGGGGGGFGSERGEALGGVGGCASCRCGGPEGGDEGSGKEGGAIDLAGGMCPSAGWGLGWNTLSSAVYELSRLGFSSDRTGRRG